MPYPLPERLVGVTLIFEQQFVHADVVDVVPDGGEHREEQRQRPHMVESYASDPACQGGGDQQANQFEANGMAQAVTGITHGLSLYLSVSECLWWPIYREFVIGSCWYLSIK